MKVTRFLRFCSTVLVMALLINLLPAQVLGAQLRSSETDTETSPVYYYENQMGDPGTATIVGENTDGRSQFSKEYIMSNGLRMAVVYPEAVHYNDNGIWKEIDNTLKTVGYGNNATLTNTAGAWKVSFPALLSNDKQISVSKDGYTLRFAMGGELRTNTDGVMTAGLSFEWDQISDLISKAQLLIEEASNARATIEELDLSALRDSMEYPETFIATLFSKLKYENIYENTDVEYDLNSSQVKESIILETFDPELVGYRYTLDTGGMIPVLEEDGTITLYAEDHETIIMTMPAPYLIDNDGVRSDDISMTMEQQDNGYVLYYQLPYEWMADDDRAWPVVLDPIIEADTTSKNILDQFVAEDYSPSYTSGALMCGYYPDFGRMRTFIMFSELPSLTSADVVVDAALTLTYLGGTSGTTIIGAHKVNATWDSKTIKWSNQPSYNSSISDFNLVGNSGQYSWNITDIVQDWYETGNTGIMLKALDSIENGTANNWKKFYSVDYSVYNTERWPTLTLKYLNTTGLESYWDATANGAGRAGTGYISNYSGNLVWIRTDLGFGGNRMPVSISHIYNSSDANNNEFGLGNGWRTNYNQKAYPSSGGYIWEDGDGTKHFFNWNSSKSVYEDEDGLELELTTLSNGVKISDKNGNASYFDSAYRLYKMENNQAIKSSIKITYTDTTGFKISTIKDGVDRTYIFTYSNGLLSKIAYTGKGSSELAVVTYLYNNGDLIWITDNDGQWSGYTYNSSHLLLTATDVDGYMLQYTYTSGAVNRISNVKEYQTSSGSSVLGGSLDITYTHNQTKFVDHNGNVQISQFNDFGNTIAIQDDKGRAEYAKYAWNSHSDATNSGNNSKANQLILASRMQNTVSNLIPQGNFESGGKWIELNSYITASISSDCAYFGNKSMKLLTIASSYVWSNLLYTDCDITFSAYIKASPGISAYLVFADINDNVVAKSDSVTVTQDWTRVEVHYTPSGTTALYPEIKIEGAGTAYVDGVQIEKMPTASRYNLLEYSDSWGGSSLASAWSKSQYMATSDGVNWSTNTATTHLDGYTLAITGDPQKEKYVSQTINQSGSAGDCYVLSGWAYGNSAPLSSYDGQERKFGLKLIFNNTDGTTTESYVAFNDDLPAGTNWQYAATPAVAEKAYSSVTVQCLYNYNVNTVYFDGIQLFKESFGSSYTYDDDGNLISVVDLQNTITNYEYANNDLTKILENNKAKMKYEYDSYHNVIKATTQKKDTSGNIVDDIVYSFEYDAYGNNTLVRVGTGDTAITTSATYTSDYNRMATSTDDLANITTYCYNENTNVLEWVQYPNDTDYTWTSYTYDSMYRLANARAIDATLSPSTTLTASYTYTNDLLTEIETTSTTYSFVYGDFAQRSSIMVGDRTLASYTYTDDQNHYLDQLTYGNGDTINYEYDDEGRVTKETFEDGSTVSYAYDNTGALATVTDSATGRKTTYYYDLTDRLVKYVDSGSGYEHGVTYTYDSLNNLQKLVETINGVKHETTYTYDYENRLTLTDYGNGITESVNYDDYGRLYFTQIKKDDESVLVGWYQYSIDSPVGAQSTVLGGIQTYTPADYTLNAYYSHDGNGNITRYYMYGAYDLEWLSLLSADDEDYTSRMGEVYYHYDASNQLIREDSMWQDKTFVWEYDNAGNITACKEYAYTGPYDEVTGTPVNVNTYTYGDTSWGDLLTAYNGATRSYDAIGNLLSDGTWSYTWQNGRELSSMSNGSTTWSYTYDANGMRTSRSNGSTTYNYVYNGSQLVQMTVGNDTLYFTYGAVGPTTVTWNGTTYYYAINGQGDVIGIFDVNGNCVVTYNWDNAWGYNPEPDGPMADTLGTLNPLRYRSYVYDEETGYYYLQSRYYDPEICRFINADNYPATGQGFTGNNMFVYCGNNPVSRKDTSGDLWGTVAIGVITQYVSDVVGNLIDGKTGIDVFMPTSSLGDYIAAGVTALIPGTGIGAAFVRNIASEGISIIEDAIVGNEINLVNSVTNVGLGTILDVGFEKVTDKVVDFISSKEPKNYSSYAHKVCTNKSNMSREQILVRMRRSIRINRALSEVTEVAFGFGRACLPY